MNPLDLLKYAFAAGVAYTVFRAFHKILNEIIKKVRAEKAKSGQSAGKWRK